MRSSSARVVGLLLIGIVAFAVAAPAASADAEELPPTNVWSDHCYIYIQVLGSAVIRVYYNPLGCWP